ncbi:DUF4381 family protein [Luteimonas notoginsengisoli]|jgi:hypothetical protein|uniref:DUF4381 family protein n=1 Tax=Luteimonas notoginsengisoli TaxID=1578200 RepID=A0ABV7UUG3_9GAMM
MAMQDLPLRDIHQPPPPPWWPPAPGWWWLATVLLVLLAFAAWWWLRARRRRAAIVRLFDERVDAAATPVERVAAMSELLRRAARRRDPAADRLQGDAWLAFLDGDMQAASAKAPFSAGAGHVLLDGGFRREIDDDAAAALLPLARRRYLELMALRR